jgi:hypothetical protein
MSPFLLLLLPALLLLLFGLLELAACGRCLRRRRRLRALPHGVVGSALLIAALALGALSATLWHYQRLGEQETVAQLTLRQLAPQRYAVRLDTADGRHRSFELLGDEWQLDARLLRWQLPALLAGAPNLYRLERLSGRYGDIKQEIDAPRSVHALAEEAFPDLWTLRRQFPQWLQFVDADYGSAAYLPMLDGARYEVTLGPRGGLLARPADAETEALLQAAGW